MPAHSRRRPQPQQDPIFNEQGVYCCSHCGRPLQLEMVVTADIERVNEAATGYILFQHFCRCDSATMRVSRGWGSYPSFLALFGSQPRLPYQAPFAWQGVADDDPTLRRWRWELAQVRAWDDFVLFLDDAAERRAA